MPENPDRDNNITNKADPPNRPVDRSMDTNGSTNDENDMKNQRSNNGSDEHENKIQTSNQSVPIAPSRAPIEMTSLEDERVVIRYLEEEMQSSYIDYSMSVIVQRALPDVRDGLKPVHRRILYAMGAVAGDARWQHAVKLVNAAGDTLKQIFGTAHAHQIARFAKRQ